MDVSIRLRTIIQQITQQNDYIKGLKGDNDYEYNCKKFCRRI